MVSRALWKKIINVATMELEKELMLDWRNITIFPYNGGSYLGYGLVVTDDFALFLGGWNIKNSPTYYYPQILSMDLSTGLLALIDPEEMPGNDLKTIYPAKMEYDGASELLWFWRWGGVLNRQYISIVTMRVQRSGQQDIG